MGVSVDTRKAFLVRQHGDITAIYTWMDEDRVLILVPTFRKGAPWYCIKESAAYKYDDDLYLANQAKLAADILGMGDERSAWVRIGTIILEGLPDLIEMPSAPAPELSRDAIGQVLVRADGEVIGGEDIRLPKAVLEYE